MQRACSAPTHNEVEQRQGEQIPFESEFACSDRGNLFISDCPTTSSRVFGCGAHAQLLSDPAQNTLQLTSQLRQLGLYAADTIGDGNCLFRALSDQLYGTDSHHLQIRSDICNWIEAHKSRYEPFVEDERGLDVHLSLMRQAATYGGHLELSAFAHMARRDVKVIQPGLVYVIEWSTGGVDSDADEGPSSSSSPPPPPELPDDSDDEDENDTVLRRKCVYVAYHDWEHFSSIRNLRGPHDGPPHVRELAAHEAVDLPPPPSKKPVSKAKAAAKSAASKPASRASKSQRTTAPSTPSQVPLPSSRSASPEPITLRPRDQRSPKRSFDESSASSALSEASAPKRSRHEDMDIDEDADTPALSDAGSTASSPLSSSSPSPAPPPERTLTRRQRKALGLPKPRTRSAGKIVIPGGRFRTRAAVKAEEEADTGEWQRNGVGRVDVRGFRELRI
ncbi:cysteine proteinase [Artomyces pyxidatus]|uniref:Cysteine proteinase n=1 Tax=Artomyces pyxidatus TaxID=48021 RepID=A0ACB8SYS4_9AGAM|nr:cysteine proteinase [Artomyces pyxidatus]